MNFNSATHRWLKFCLAFALKFRHELYSKLFLSNILTMYIQLYLLYASICI